MNFSFTEEQEELRRYTRQWLDSNCSMETVRLLMDSQRGYQPGHWEAIAEMGWLGMAIPEEWGGAGFSFLELFVLLEEQGRSLFCSPFLSTVVMAATVVEEAGNGRQKQEILGAISEGSLIATVAVTEPNGRWDEEGVTAEARDHPQGGWILGGSKSFVLDGHVADLLVVAARTDQGVSLFLVPGKAEGVERNRLETMDQTRKQAEIELRDVRVEAGALLGTEGAGWPVVERMMEKAAVALAAEQVGGAQACLEMAVSYAKVRKQFGRPIGSFQAIKHKCADMLAQVESARSAAYYAGWAVSEDHEERSLMASLAKSYCSEAFFTSAAENIQIHGGIGFTWEHDAHLYFKRAKSSELLFGDPSLHREKIAVLLGL
ncbi:MAG: acyl-CoA/acyl-ACP dehydrogenase [Actinomycetia bacterium]|nr:acyl-CoA/acyl-ACP dehydrogenase [Actinomycetes bacterium]